MDTMMKIGNVAVDTLVKGCGSPLYVYDEEKIDSQLDAYKTHFKSDKFDTRIIYASKAFSCGAMIQKLKDFDYCLDVVSGGELFVAQQNDFNSNNIYFHGNNKTKEELVQALQYGVKTIVVDNFYETDLLIALSDEYAQDVHVLIRVNPKVEAHTHEYIMTANADSKFGISVDLKEDIYEMIAKIEASKHVFFDGFHFHIGSQIFERQGFVEAINKTCKFIHTCQEETGVSIQVLNIGGGFGVKYTDEDRPTTTQSMCKTLIECIENNIEQYSLSLTQVCTEPGRSIVAEAGYTIYEVGFIKKTANKQFLFVNGGMADNIRPSLYEAQYACDIANKMGVEKTEVYDIAGKCCESGDILIKQASLPKADSQDYLVVYSTGAYGYTMASNYNRLNKLPVVFVKKDVARLVVKGETYAQQIQNDCDIEVKL